MADGLGAGPAPRSGETLHERPPGAGGPRELAHAAEEGVIDRPRSASFAGGHTGAQRRSSPHSGKFLVAMALLAGIGVAAVIVAAALLLGGRPVASSGGPWSDWKPTDSGLQGAREIADHVAPLYRISPTDQLSVVTVVNVASASATAAALSGGTAGPSSGLQVAVQTGSGSGISLLDGNTIAYDLCGIGTTDCAIGVGTPSANRLLLLRREALELALYTLRYLGSVDNVVAILPPGHTEQTSALTPKPPSAGARAAPKPVDIAVLFLRDELGPLLRQPLSSLLPEQFPPTVDEMPAAPEAGLVSQVTGQGLFSEKMVQAQDGGQLLMLTKLPPE